MFGIGMPELLVILAVALIVIGPKKLPDLARSLGKALGEFKRATNDLKQSIEKETGLDDVRNTIRQAGQEARRPHDPFKAAGANPTSNEAAPADRQDSSPAEDPATQSPTGSHAPEENSTP